MSEQKDGWPEVELSGNMAQNFKKPGEPIPPDLTAAETYLPLQDVREKADKIYDEFKSREMRSADWEEATELVGYLLAAAFPESSTEAGSE